MCKTGGKAHARTGAGGQTSAPSHCYNTEVEQGANVAPNLLQQDFHTDKPNQKWTSDTTSVWKAEGCLFLAVVLDVLSRMVVGWSMAAVQDTTLVINALKMALARRGAHSGYSCLLIVAVHTRVKAISCPYGKTAYRQA